MERGIKKFNIRVYGIILKKDKFLCIHEYHEEEKLTKLPGGGLEFGEGTIECLFRELKEELNITIHNIRHFYTQEDFIRSKFNSEEQLLTIYYLADYVEGNRLELLESTIDSVEWLSLQNNENPFTLPVDQLVYKKLLNYYNLE